MPTVNNIKLVVFDLDDTLYREMDFVLGGLKAVAKHLSQHDDDAIYQKMVTMRKGGRRDIFQQILSERNMPSSRRNIDRLIDIYRTSDRELRLFDDAKRALIRFRRDGFSLAILTDGFLEAQQAKVKMLSLGEMVDKIIYTDSLGREHWKPSPRGFEILMEHFRAAGEESIYIADNDEKDFLAPNNLDWLSVKIERPDGVHHHKTPPTPRHKPQLVLDSLDNLLLQP